MKEPRFCRQPTDSPEVPPLPSLCPLKDPPQGWAVGRGSPRVPAAALDPAPGLGMQVGGRQEAEASQGNLQDQSRGSREPGLYQDLDRDVPSYGLGISRGPFQSSVHLLERAKAGNGNDGLDAAREQLELKNTFALDVSMKLLRAGALLSARP